MTTRKMTHLLCLTALLGSHGLYADQSHNLHALQVNAPIDETLSAELGRFGSRVEVVTRDDLEQLGVTDIAQALQLLVPGLYVAPKHGRFDYVNTSLQGSRSADILWLVDGVRINNRLFGGTSPLDSIPAHMVQRVEVLKGGQSLFYGTQALGGVVNIITRGFSDETDGALGLGTGTLGERQVNGYVRDTINGHRFVLFGSHAQAEGYTPFKDNHLEPSAQPGGSKRGYNVTSLGGKYQRDIGADRRLTLQYIRNEAAVDFARPTDNFHTVNDRSEDILIAKWDQYLSDDLSFFLKAYYHEWATDYTRLYNTEDENTLSVRNDRDPWGYEDYGMNAMGSWFFGGGNELVFGADWQQYSGNDKVLLIETRTESVAAVFAQFRPKLEFAPDSNLAVGARYNKARLGGENLIWNFSSRQALGRNHYVRSNLGTAFRLPDAYQLYSIDPNHPQGNQDLDGEESLNADIGLGGTGQLRGMPVTWEVTVFGREIRDLIKRDTVDAISTFVNTDDRVRMTGGELILSMAPSPGWRTAISTTYTQAREKGSDEQIDDIPKYFAKASLGYDHPSRRYGAQLSAVYIGTVHRQISGVGRERYGNHLITDATAYYRAGVGLRHRLGLRLENVADVVYASTIQRGVRDDDTPYRYDNLATPRNLQLTYAFTF